jgi:hypothetical protein
VEIADGDNEKVEKRGLADTRRGCVWGSEHLISIALLLNFLIVTI